MSDNSNESINWTDVYFKGQEEFIRRWSEMANGAAQSAQGAASGAAAGATAGAGQTGQEWFARFAPQFGGAAGDLAKRYFGFYDQYLGATRSLWEVLTKAMVNPDPSARASAVTEGLQALQQPFTQLWSQSASMFGLIGSIMLGFQAVVVSKTIATLVDNIREEVLSLAEKSQENANVAITERYLATLLADMMEQHRLSEARLADVAQQITALTPSIVQAAQSSTRLADVVAAQHEALDRTTHAVGQVRDVVPLIAELASASSENLRESAATRTGVDEITRHLPDQAVMSEELKAALQAMTGLRAQLDESRATTRELSTEVRLQGAVLKRLDAALSSNDKSALRKVLERDPQA